MQSTTPLLKTASLPVVLSVVLVVLSGCTANVTSGSFYSVHIGQKRAGVIDGLQQMGVARVRMVPRTTAIGTISEPILATAEIDLREAGRHVQLLRSRDETCWEFHYNDRLGNRAVRLEFNYSVLSRIHVRWYPPGLFASS